jgi:YidC/Oxa1 family membrane protein insertase
VHKHESIEPEINELGKRKTDGKKQQETMKLYNKAGVNPMGCYTRD